MSHTYRSRFEVDESHLNNCLTDLCINDLFTANDLRLLEEYRRIYFGPEALIAQAAANKAFSELCEQEYQLSRRLKLTPLGVTIEHHSEGFNTSRGRDNFDQDLATSIAKINIKFLKLWDKYRQSWKAQTDDIDGLVSRLKQIVDEGGDSPLKIPATVLSVLKQKGFIVPDEVRTLKPSEVIEGLKITMQHKEDGTTADVTFAGREFNIHVDAGANLLSCKRISDEIQKAVAQALSAQTDPFGMGLRTTITESGFGDDGLGAELGLKTNQDEPVVLVKPSNTHV